MIAIYTSLIMGELMPVQFGYVKPCLYLSDSGDTDRGNTRGITLTPTGKLNHNTHQALPFFSHTVAKMAEAQRVSASDIYQITLFLTAVWCACVLSTLSFAFLSAQSPGSHSTNTVKPCFHAIRGVLLFTDNDRELRWRPPELRHMQNKHSHILTHMVSKNAWVHPLHSHKIT